MKPMGGQRKGAIVAAAGLTALFVVGWLAIAGGLPTVIARPIAEITGTVTTRPTPAAGSDAFTSTTVPNAAPPAPAPFGTRTRPSAPPDGARPLPHDGEHHGWPHDHHDDDDDDD